MIRTWQAEMFAVAAVLAAVALARGGRLEWLGSGAVLMTFAHAQVAERLREREAARSVPEVACHRWLAIYYVAKESAWFAYFAIAGAWSALAGVLVFLLYPAWRRHHRGRHPLGGA